MKTHQSPPIRRSFPFRTRCVALARISTWLLAMALVVPTLSFAQSQTRPPAPERQNDRLELGPVSGFTTTWHPAPTATAAPLGATLRFRVRSPQNETLEWSGAQEVARTVFSIAEVTLTSPGTHRVSVRYPDGAGSMTEESIDLEVQPLPPDGIQISPISIAVDPLDLSQVPTNPVTMRFFFRQDSIARLTEVAPGHYRTSVNRWMTLQAEVEPAAFAPLVEWSLDGVPQRTLGSPLRMVVFPARSFDIEAGVGDLTQQVRLDTYRVKITSHENRRADIPDDEAVTFTAVTDPPGHEAEITWLASTKHGTALPLTGTGPELTTVFVNTRGEEQRWLGVRADNATVSADAKLSANRFGDDNAEEVPRISVRPDLLCGNEPSHRLEILWDILNVQEPKLVRIEVVSGRGSSFEINGDVSGSAAIPMDAPLGDSAIVIMSAAPLEPDANRSSEFVRIAQTATLLPPCEVLTTPPPGEGFEPSTVLNTETGSGSIQEADVVALGSPSPNVEQFVTAVGSGSAFRLAVWQSSNGAAPILIQQTDPILGFDVRLQGLTPDEPGVGDSRPFVASMRGEDGNLRLSLYSVNDVGNLVLHNTVGYGANAGLVVEAYGITHRLLPSSSGDVFQIVTPVRTLLGDLRLVIWKVDSMDLELRGVQDSGRRSEAVFDTAVGVAYLGEDLYLVTSKTTSGDLRSQFWQVDEDGQVVYAGQSVSGVSLRGTAPVEEPLFDLAVAPLDRGGYVTATSSDAMDEAEVAVWEVFRFGELQVFSETLFLNAGLEPPPAITFTYRITDNREDDAPDDFGIDIDEQPTLTNGVDDDGQVQEVGALLADALWEQFREDSGELLGEREDEVTGIASVTKMMTLILALEDVDAKHVSLGQLVNISLKAAERAAKPNNSRMGLNAFETWSLEDLLYGLTINSGNDAAIAIAEGQFDLLDHLIYDPTGFFRGEEAAFVRRMNRKASSLGLEKTEYGASWAVSNSTPREQARLMLYGLSNVPRFQHFLSLNELTVESDPLFSVAGVAGRSVPLTKGDNGYPGLIAYKGGSRGGMLGSVPGCTPAGCLVAAVTRLGRTLIVTLQQSGDIVGNSIFLFDYGYQQQFTPDFRGDDNGVAGPAVEFALDKIRETAFETKVVSLVVGGGQLEICLWDADAGEGQLDQRSCGSQPAPSLPSGDTVDTPAVELLRISTGDAAGDYLRGYLRDGNLNLDLWRIAPKQPPEGVFVPSTR